MIAAILAWLAVWWPVLGFVAALGLLVWNHMSYLKWYNSPENVAYRQRQAYDAAHAYLKGKCCCGRTEN